MKINRKKGEKSLCMEKLSGFLIKKPSGKSFFIKKLVS